MDVSIDWRVLAFALLVSAVVALLSSAVPLRRSTRIDLVVALKSSSAASGPGRGQNRLLRAVIIAELGFASVLLVAGALLVSSLVGLLRADLGFDTRALLTMQVRPLGGDATLGDPVRFYDALLERVAAIPGVQSAAATWAMPLSNRYSGSGFTIEGRPAPAEWRKMSAQNCLVTPGYSKAMGMRLLRGRDFDRGDRADTRHVVVINQALANRHWTDADPIGARLVRGHDSFTVVGVVSDVRYNGPAQSRPAGDVPASRPGTLLRAVPGGSHEGRPAKRARGDQAAGSRAESRRGGDSGAEMEDLLVERVGGTRLIAEAMAGFAVLALLLAGVGLYGAMAQWVGQRRQELVVRVALSARARRFSVSSCARECCCQSRGPSAAWESLRPSRG